MKNTDKNVKLYCIVYYELHDCNKYSECTITEHSILIRLNNLQKKYINEYLHLVMNEQKIKKNHTLSNNQNTTFSRSKQNVQYV